MTCQAQKQPLSAIACKDGKPHEVLMRCGSGGLAFSRMSSRALRLRRLAVLVPGLAPDPDPLLCLSRIALLSNTSRRPGWLPRGDPNARSWLRLTALPDLQRDRRHFTQTRLWEHKHLI
jgi:hypothetical protein